MEGKNFVGYYRVSTKDQGKSGLGLDSQKRSVIEYINSTGQLVGEFRDIESGTSNDRKGIKAAIEACKLHNATLVVKEMSRISRGGFKIMVELDEAGINFIESTAPNDPAMVKGIKFVLAKDEREKISTRTKNALNEIKEKVLAGEVYISKAGKVVEALGSPQNLNQLARDRSIASRKRKAYNNPENKRAGAFIIALKQVGKTNKYITEQLNKSGFKTSKDNNFSEMQVSRLYKRYINS